MSKLTLLLELIKDQKKRSSLMFSKGLYDGLSDEKYLKKLYKLKTGRELDLDNPKTFTEKIQWIKLYDRNPQYTVMQDKYLVRDFISDKIGDEYLIPFIGVWDRAEDIDFQELPDEFVLKCNHDCASVTICRDKTKLDIEKTREKLNKCLSTDYSKYAKEWAYKDIPHKIIAEKYMQNADEETLVDHKFYCFNGKAKAVMLISGVAHTGVRNRAMFDMNFQPLPVRKKNDSECQVTFEKPAQFEKIKELVEKIAAGIPFVRVDFYVVNGKPYFGEVAFYPDSGFVEFYPFEWEQRFGEWIKLPERVMNDDLR